MSRERDDGGLEELFGFTDEPVAGDRPTEQRPPSRAAWLIRNALLEVYRQARYATHTVDDQMRTQAVSALQRLRADLGAEATP